MRVRRLGFLSEAEAAQLRAAPWTYDAVGASGSGVVPAGYHALSRGHVLGQGRQVFERACRDLLEWQVQLRSGLGVRADGPVREGAVAVVRIGVGPAAVNAPVRVVRIVEQSDRVAFAYGTLPGHPESGEEEFAVAIDPAGDVTVRIEAFSRPALWWSRLAAPGARLVQVAVTGRYLRALA
ncbi:DUF1990 domain-containing protein [Nocardioides albidus]|uniref:DUF1990 domain-containing protein n=2 Tax=Nocardioides albidus TaxID=1517589 RepID=A0A5C4VMZ8_9ACTN|nr:DUF1990 domain-containing protein [Nocardioides albidus]